MPKSDLVVRIWSLEYRLLMTVINSVAKDVSQLGLEMKELFVLSEVDEHPYPAELADQLCMPKATISVYMKNLEKAGFVKREIDPGDLRRHKLLVTPAGRKTLTRGLAFLADAFGDRLARLTTAEQAKRAELVEKMS